MRLISTTIISFLILFVAGGGAFQVARAQSGLGQEATVRPQGSVVYRQQLRNSATTATLVFNNQQSLYYFGRKEVATASAEL